MTKHDEMISDLEYRATMADTERNVTAMVDAEYFRSSANTIRELCAERDAAVARVAELEVEVERLRSITTRFPDHMAQIIAAKDEALDTRLERLIATMDTLPEYLHGYQWVADEKQYFGEKYIRHVTGDNGHGMGRQWLASCPPHIDSLADYIAAANPDTIAMILADRGRLTVQARVQGMREAAEICRALISAARGSGLQERKDGIRDASDAIITRAEEIETEAKK